MSIRGAASRQVGPETERHAGPGPSERWTSRTLLNNSARLADILQSKEAERERAGGDLVSRPREGQVAVVEGQTCDGAFPLTTLPGGV